MKSEKSPTTMSERCRRTNSSDSYDVKFIVDLFSFLCPVNRSSLYLYRFVIANNTGSRRDAVVHISAALGMGTKNVYIFNHLLQYIWVDGNWNNCDKCDEEEPIYDGYFPVYQSFWHFSMSIVLQSRWMQWINSQDFVLICQCLF